MRIVANRNALLQAVQLAAGACGARDVKPILRNIKLAAESTGCVLSGTDLEVGVAAKVASASVETPGACLLPAAKIAAILGAMADEEVSLEADASGCMVRGAAAEFELPGEDPTQFPDLPVQDGQVGQLFKAGAVHNLIKRTTFAAAAVEHSRFAATMGLAWEMAEGVLRTIATDGRRLAVAAEGAEAFDGKEQSQMPVLPIKAVRLLDKILTGDLEQGVSILFRPNDALFATERAMVYSRLVEGRFPNWRTVLPKRTRESIPLAVGQLMTCVRQAAIMTDEESKRVTFRFENKKLTLEAKGSETGRSKAEMAIDSERKVEIRFDPKFVLEFLKVLDPAATIEAFIQDAQTAAVLKVGEDYQVLLVPLVAALSA